MNDNVEQFRKREENEQPQAEPQVPEGAVELTPQAVRAIQEFEAARDIILEHSEEVPAGGLFLLTSKGPKLFVFGDLVHAHFGCLLLADVVKTEILSPKKPLVQPVGGPLIQP